MENKKNAQKKIVRIINYFLSFSFVIVLFYFSLRGLDLKTLKTYILSANYWWAVASLPVMFASHWVRAIRWRTILNPISKSGSIWNLFSAVMAGYAVNNLIPRGGELIRPFYYSRREKISFTMTFATIIVERFLDLISLILLFTLVSFFLRNQLRLALPNLHIENLFVPTLLLITLVAISFNKKWIDVILTRLIKPFSIKLYDKLDNLFKKFFFGLQSIKEPKLYFQLIYESFLMWFLYTVPLYLMFFSFTFGVKYNLGFDDAILLIVISGVGYTIAPTPGAIGFYHFLIQNALFRLYGISLEEALAYATVTHAVNYFSQVIVGGLFLLREQIHLNLLSSEIANLDGKDLSENSDYKQN
ncbi:MAG: lysylphosphatidylglycerol synthase transmembrane domain-containing protein [Candidatus Kapaibacteriales bacterium]